MKTIASYLLAILLSVTFAGAQNKKELKLDSFNKISFRAEGKLYLRQGSTQKVEVEGDDEYIKELDIRVDGGRLTMGRDNWSFWNNNNNNSRNKVTIYVTIPEIQGVDVSGSGDLFGETKITAKDLDLNVSGSGSMELEADASGLIDADVTGSGNIKLNGKSQNFETRVSGSGKVTLTISVAERATFGLSGSGKVIASGSAQQVKATITGSGQVLASDLVVDECNVRISGSGDVEINVNKALDANISGSGSVTYKGNPSQVNSHSSGSGKVRKW